MANYHIALSRSMDLDGIAQAASLGESPRHAMGLLRDRLNAKVHTPRLPSVDPVHSMYVNLIGKPEHWQLAAELSGQLTGDDVIYCTGEDIGIPIAALCAGRRDRADRPKIVMFVHFLNRPRAHLAFKLFGVADRVDLFVAVTQAQLDFLQKRCGVPASKILFSYEQTDNSFFCPGPAQAKTRPIIASVGLEQRDYRSLAAATADLDVDVRISGFSHDTRDLKKYFPDEMPANMSRRFYEWSELVQLYRDADVVVLSLLPNAFAAGVSCLLEAMACGRPVIVSQTVGLVDYWSVPGALIPVPVGDVATLRSQILALLNDPSLAAKQGDRCRQQVQRSHDVDRFVALLAQQLESLGTQVKPRLVHPAAAIA
jgi:glycosyltransferase involved in cell wall biosynthesis